MGAIQNKTSSISLTKGGSFLVGADNLKDLSGNSITDLTGYEMGLKISEGLPSSTNYTPVIDLDQDSNNFEETGDTFYWTLSPAETNVLDRQTWYLSISLTNQDGFKSIIVNSILNIQISA